MIGADATDHLAFGFFMNWFGAQAGEGFEYQGSQPHPRGSLR
jgi:hypothetical protein